MPISRRMFKRSSTAPPSISPQRSRGSRAAFGSRTTTSTEVLSYLRQPVEIVWYPSARMFSQTGIIVGGYADNEPGTPFGDLKTVEAKLNASRHAIELLHPGHGKELTKPIYVNWGKIQYALGGWLSDYSGKSIERLLEPDGCIYFVGDQTSKLSGWQEGAALSAYRCMNQIGTEVEKRAPHAA